MTTSEPTTRTGLFEGETRVEAPPDVVLRYLTDPDLYVRWGGRKAELDPRPGGIYRVELNPGFVSRGEYVEVSPERVAYTFGWETDGDHPIPPGSTLVEIDLVPDGDATLVRIRHSGLPEDAVDDHRDGWSRYFARLAIAAPGGDPGPSPTFDD